MKITIIAKSQEKESYVNDNQVWYKEYAIGELNTEKDRQEMNDKFGAREIYKFYYPCVSMDRRVNITNGVKEYQEWNYYWFQDGIFKTALTLSNGFHSATGLDPIYERVIKHIERETSLQKELNELDNRITPCKFSRYSPLLQEYLNKYECELKDRKLWRKAQNNNAPIDIINEIKKRLNQEYEEELNRINTRIEEIKHELEVLTSEE